MMDTISSYTHKFMGRRGEIWYVDKLDKYKSANKTFTVSSLRNYDIPRGNSKIYS